MNWLNYHHLLYFWKVAKEGSIARASVELRLASPTISVQIHQLEEMRGQKLFRREGRGLALTESGRVAFRYADSIFATGDALVQAMAHDTAPRAVRLVVGLSAAVPKSIVQRILLPVFAMDPRVAVSISRDRTAEEFLAELAAGAVDVVLADSPAPTNGALRVFSHPVGECGTIFVAEKSVAERLSGEFPGSVNGEPFLFPRVHSALRGGIDEWCYAHGVAPLLVAELDDAALMVALAAAGVGIMATTEMLEAEMLATHQLHVVGRAPQLRQPFFAWTLERKTRHPAVVALCATAEERLLG